MHNSSYYQIDSLGRFMQIQLDPPEHSISSYFMEGGPWFITLLTLLLIALLFASWKAPAWVRIIGKASVVAGCFFTMVAIYQMADAISLVGDINYVILAEGIKSVVLPLCYGLLIDFLALVISLTQKPRI